jgi:DNA replication protein DnaC
MMEVYKKTPYLGIDDMGKEPKEVLDYGNVCNPVIDLIEYRYDKQLTTFITTNLPPKSDSEKKIVGIDTHYGVRIADRFNEMIEKIVFNDGSYRR